MIQHLTLERGKTYEFDISLHQGHPFWIKTDQINGSSSQLIMKALLIMDLSSG